MKPGEGLCPERRLFQQKLCKVFNNLEDIDTTKWVGLKTLVQIDRTVTRKEVTTKETAYFISGLPQTTKAHAFNKGVRKHWGIESFHYIKDVTFNEDKWKVHTKDAPANYSLMRNLTINIFRKNNLHNIQETVEKCANNVPFMMSLL